MNRRKLLSRREEYLKNIEESPEQVRASSQFYNQLRNYYRRKWGVNLQLPRVNGIEVNLYKLYQAVKTFGGWCRTTNTDKWYDVARDVLGLGDETVSADYCARQIYMRYLAKFEQYLEHGIDTDDHETDIMGSSRNRIRGYSLYTSECPIQFPRRSDQPDDQLQYDKIIKSLASGLPNEVDFALNTCSIMSAPGPFVFDLDRHSGLITLIVGQAGVFDDNSDFLQQEFIRNQNRTTKRDFPHFWSNAGIDDEDVLKIFSMVKKRKYSELDYQLFPTLKYENHEHKKVKTVEFRVQQVLDIIRNLSFESSNQPILANNWACLKFLVICISTDKSQLKNSALDALSELASQICLSTDILTTILLRQLRSFIFSDDRILVMRAAEVIGSLCANPENESIMCDFLESDILDRLFELISAKDVLICVNTLDSLYNISEAGKTLCERLAQVPRCVELLVNFCTIEASQFTTNGLYGIKVIEYQGGHDQSVGNSIRPSTSYYHPQHSIQNRTLPVPLQPLPSGSTSSRPQVIVSSKGDIATVATNKPLLAAQLARPVQSAEFAKRESITLNGSQVQQIRILNGNGEPIMIQQATSSLISANIVIKNEQTAPVNDEEDKMETSQESSSTTSKDLSTSDEQIDVPDAEDEIVISTEQPNLNGSDHSENKPNGEEHPLVNGAIKHDENQTDKDEEILVNGALSPSYIKENGCIKETNENEILNGAAKKPKLKVKKRPITDNLTKSDSNGSSGAKKARTTPKKKIQKNGYIQPEEDATTEASPTAHSHYARVPTLMCEWDACTNFFHTGSAMIYHILHEHIDAKKENETEQETPTTSSTSEDNLIYCLWPGCERTPRSRWSLITHLQENHCNENALNMATRKRREIGDFNYVATLKQRLQETTPAINHPGYTKFAAYDAIRRHAFNYLTRDITEEHQEGPVTKDLRLTSALILRNLAKNSAECRKRLRPHEGFLSYLSMSRLESSSALAQCLAALSPVDF